MPMANSTHYRVTSRVNRRPLKQRTPTKLALKIAVEATMYNPTPLNLLSSLDSISAARLSSYRRFFNPASDTELYGLYCWNEVISTNFMRLTGIVEVALRNRFHLALSQYAMAQHPSRIIGSADANNWYEVLALSGKSSEKVQAVTHDRYWNKAQKRYIYTPKLHPVSPNQVIANMTFGFWAPLLDLGLSWNTIIPTIFPYHRYASNAGHWNNKTTVGTVYARLETLRSLRNRVAHFEPLWKIPDIKEEKKEVKGVTVNVEYPAPATEAEVLARLNMLYRRITQTLHWLSKDRASDHEQSEFHQKSLYLMTQEALDGFKCGYAHSDVKLSSMTKSWGMKLVLKSGKPIQISHQQKVIGNFYPTH